MNELKNIKRYEFEFDDSDRDTLPVMREDIWGRFIKYEQVEELFESLNETIAINRSDIMSEKKKLSELKLKLAKADILIKQLAKLANCSVDMDNYEIKSK